jgi:hypothetical protein
MCPYRVLFRTVRPYAGAHSPVFDNGLPVLGQEGPIASIYTFYGSEKREAVALEAVFNVVYVQTPLAVLAYVQEYFFKALGERRVSPR